MPVTILDGKPVGDGKPGNITTVLRKRYWETHDENHWAEPVDYPVSPLPQGEGVS